VECGDSNSADNATDMNASQLSKRRCIFGMVTVDKHEIPQGKRSTCNGAVFTKGFFFLDKQDGGQAEDQITPRY
jgi:hypothetical protein